MVKKITILLFILIQGQNHFMGSLHGNPLHPVIQSQISVHHLYGKMIDEYQNKNWKKLSYKCLDIIQEFPESPFAKEGRYYLGVAYYKLGEYEYANHAFSDYLKGEFNPKFFDEVIRFKFEIAQAFKEGARKHLFGWGKMPKWLPAYEEALSIYEEVITTIPRDDLAAKALYHKGLLLLQMEEYKTSIETFRTLIRRFPKHPLSPEGYLEIINVYLKKCKNQFSDSDNLDQAEINLRKFYSHFPNEPRIIDAQKSVQKIKEHLAEDLLYIAEFYKRTKKEEAAIIYYSTILKKYPETKAATQSKKQLKKIDVPDNYLQKQKDQKDVIVDSNN